MKPTLLILTFVVGCSGVSPIDAGTGGGGGGGDGGGGDGGSQVCSPSCGASRSCCNGACTNTANDPGNCGGCGITCSGATPYCAGTCKPTPCGLDGGACDGGASCCGTSCCGAGQLCCDPQGPLSTQPTCFTPTATEPTCPQGCAPLCISDRNLKSDFSPVDERAVLDTVAGLPLSTWRYANDPADTRHLGPMAQDFRAAFALGDSDRNYNSIDAHGVSLASIKALYRMLQEQEARLAKLEAENARLRAASRPRLEVR